MATKQERKQKDAARKLAVDNREEQRIRNRPKITFLISLAIAISMTIVAWYKNDGFLQIIKADSLLKADKKRISRLKAENAALVIDIKKANKDMKRVEKFARENLNLVKKDDLVFHFHEESSDYLTRKTK